MFRTRITFSIAKLCFIMIYLFSNLLHVCNNLYAIFLRVLMCLASLKCWSCLSWSLATCLHSLHTTRLSIQLFLLTMITLDSIKFSDYMRVLSLLRLTDHNSRHPAGSPASAAEIVCVPGH